MGVQQISSRMAASVVALLSSLLPVVSGMVVDPSYMRYIQQSGSFLEQDPGAMLSGAINDVSDRQKQMQGANAKQLQDEASKQAKIQQDFDKVAADMKNHMDHLAQKLQETEKKAQDSEAKVQPARDDAMKQAQMAADKQLQDEMAKAKAASDDWNKKLNDENAKEQKLLTDNEKKTQADDQIAKASKVTADTEAQANKVATDMGNKLQQFEKKAADDSQKASTAMQKEQADIEKKANDEKNQMKNE